VSRSDLPASLSASDLPDSAAPAPPRRWPSIKRQELLDWFTANAPSLAPAYDGATRLLADPSFPGRLHFIAHAVRDISNRLIDALDPHKPPSRVQYEHYLDLVAKDWPSLNPTSAPDSTGLMSDAVQVPASLVAQLDQLVHAHRNRRARPSQYELLFRYLVRSYPGRTEANKRAVTAFKTIFTWFMDRAHLPASPTTPVSEDELQTHFQHFEAILHSFVGSFFTGTAELDDVIQQANA
jgi:hypothetical protein